MENNDDVMLLILHLLFELISNADRPDGSFPFSCLPWGNFLQNVLLFSGEFGLDIFNGGLGDFILTYSQWKKKYNPIISQSKELFMFVALFFW